MKKYSVPAVVGLAFLYLLAEGFKSVMADFFKWVHSDVYLLLGWTTFLSAESEESSLNAFSEVILILAILLVNLIGAFVIIKYLILKGISFFKGEGESEKPEDGIQTEIKPCQQEISNAINSVDDKEAFSEKRTKMLSFMKAFEKEVRRIFLLDKDELQCIWILPATTATHKFQIACLDDDIEDFYTFKILVESSLKQTDSRIVVEKVKQPVPQSENEQFTIVKNFGKFRLGFAMLVKKENVFNEENMQEFEELSSYLLLLGFFNSFVAGIRKVVAIKQAG